MIARCFYFRTEPTVLMSIQNLLLQNARYTRTLCALLVSTLGLGILTGCVVSEKVASNSSEVAAEETIKPTTITELYTQGLEVGMPYGKAKAKLMEQGWLPHTFATNGAIADWTNPNVEQMTNLGFAEVTDCSRAGNCSFEFVYGPDRAAEDGVILSVLTSSSEQSENEEPALSSWGMQNSVITNYEDQAFDEATYQQLQADGFCQSVGFCENQKYAFEDVLLWSAVGGFGTTKVSIFPRYAGQGLSEEAALAYARTLDVDNVIDFDDRRESSFDNSVTYYEFGTPQENIADGRGGVTLVQFQYQEDGALSEISFENVVF